MNDKIITIMMPSFNQGNYIEESINSILSQKCNLYIQLIIQDNNSNDKTKIIIETIIKRLKKNGKKEFKGINFYENNFNLGVSLKFNSKKDSGQSNALNLIIPSIKGDYVGWLNSDDIYLENSFQEIEKIFLSDRVFIVNGNSILIDNNGDPFLFEEYQGNLIRQGSIEEIHWKNNIYHNIVPGLITSQRLLLDWNDYNKYHVPPQPSIFFRKEVIDFVGFFNEKLHFTMDLDFWIRASTAFPFMFINKNLSGYRFHNSSKSNENIKSNSFYKEWKKMISPYRKNIKIKDYIIKPIEKLKNPKISIIVICYNYGHFFKECISSIVSQNYKNIEIIVISSGSSFESDEYLIEAKKIYEFKLIFGKKKRKVGLNRSLGARLAKGDYLLFLDADDLLSLGYLEQISRISSSVGFYDIIVSNVKVFGNENSSWNIKTTGLLNCLIENNISSASAIKKDFYNNIKKINDFSLSKNIHEDWGMWINLYTYKPSVYLTNQQLYYYRKHGPSLSNNNIESEYEQRKIFLEEYRDNINSYLFEEIRESFCVDKIRNMKSNLKLILKTGNHHIIYKVLNYLYEFIIIMFRYFKFFAKLK